MLTNIGPVLVPIGDANQYWPSTHAYRKRLVSGPSKLLQCAAKITAPLSGSGFSYVKKREKKKSVSVKFPKLKMSLLLMGS